MAGSYNHIVTEQGNLGSNEYVVNMLENGGDVFEAVEEMYGMIWFLASKYSEGENPTQALVATKVAVEEARQNYKAGLKRAEEIHSYFPGRGGE